MEYFEVECMQPDGTTRLVRYKVDHVGSVNYFSSVPFKIGEPLIWTVGGLQIATVLGISCEDGVHSRFRVEDVKPATRIPSWVTTDGNGNYIFDRPGVGDEDDLGDAMLYDPAVDVVQLAGEFTANQLSEIVGLMRL